MEFRSQNAQTYVPDGVDIESAIGRTTHLAIGAHQDDVPIMAYDGIRRCFRDADHWFLAVTVTDGAGSPRAGAFAHHTNEQMTRVRVEEERRAAAIGGYSAAIQLGYASSQVKRDASDVVADLTDLLARAGAETVYIHNPADKHDTHVATALRAIAAIRALPADQRPERMLGCEVWRGLDWISDRDKILLDYTDRQDLFSDVISAYESQLASGKRYDAATIGRWRANATFLASHQVDYLDLAGVAIDLTPLINDVTTDIGDYMLSYVSRLAQDISSRINRLS